MLTPLNSIEGECIETWIICFISKNYIFLLIYQLSNNCNKLKIMPDNKDENKRIAKNTLFLYIRMLFVLAVNLYTSRVLLRNLGVMDYGVYNVVAGFITMFAFLNTSLANSIQRYLNYKIGEGDREGLKDVYNASLVIQFTIALVLLILVEGIGLWYMDTYMNVPPERIKAALFIFQSTLISLIIILIQIPYVALIMAYEKMDWYAFVGVVDVILKLIIALVLPYFEIDNLILYGGLLVVVSFIDFLLYYIYVKKKVYPYKFKYNIDGKLFKSMMSFSGWNILSSFSLVMKSQGINLLLNVFYGPIVNAARGIAVQIMNALYGFSGNISLAFRPQLVQSYATKDYNRVDKIFYRESKVTFILMLVLVTPVTIDIKYILDLWLGKGAAPNFTIPFVVLVLTDMLIGIFHMPMTQLVHATGKMRSFNIATSIIAFMSLPVSYFFLKLGYGPISVFWVCLAITMLTVIISLLIVHSIYPFSFMNYLKSVIRPGLLLMLLIPIAPLVVYFSMAESFFRLLLICFTDVLGALMLAYYLALEENERKYILKFVKEKF